MTIGTVPGRRRSGFTLIELLVVVAIIGLLVALTAGGIFRVLENQKYSTTESTQTKVNTNLDRRFKAVRDQAEEDSRKNAIPPAIVTYAGSDLDRAKTVWTYLLLKNEFPTTSAEGLCPNTDQLNGTGAFTAPGDKRRGVWLWSPATLATAAVFVRPAPTVFASIPAGGTPEEQSAAHLYVALTATANKGEVAGTEGLDNQSIDIAMGAQNVRAFVDGWGKPIAFVRMAYAPEINAAPFTKTPGVDFIDKTNSLTKYTGGWTATKLTDFWTVVRANHVTALPATYSAQNWLPTTVSFGPDKLPGNLLAGTGADDGVDNLLSFRLRKLDGRGD